ncbi:MAG: hypothetical protein RL695_1866 [Pseudomonadota bacterium]|jgi:hypothetical protein
MPDVCHLFFAMKFTVIVRLLPGLLAAVGMLTSAFAEPQEGGVTPGLSREPREPEERLRPAESPSVREAVRTGGVSPETLDASQPCNGCVKPSRKNMTVEERRQLRHDINEAGRDLYKRRGSHHHP